MRKAAVLYESAYRRDPTNFLILHHYLNALAAHDGPSSAFKRAYSIATKDIQRCGDAAHRSDSAELLALWRAQIARACVAEHTLALGTLDTRIAHEMQEVLMRHGFASGYIHRAATLRADGMLNDAVALLRRGMQRVVHPRDRIFLSVALSDYLRALDKHAQAHRTDRDVDVAVRRGGPATRYWNALARAPGMSGDALDRLARDAAATARAHGVPGLCANILHFAGSLHVDRGEQARAIGLLQEGSACARQSAPHYSMVIAVKLGRALYKAGEYERALVALSEAERLARHENSNYYLADALHNRMHTHEGQGDLARARLTAERYVAAADMHGSRSLRIISLRDAGIVFWNSDQRAAARSYFDRMVELVRKEQREYHWAAEYYERVGDLPKARRFYRLSLTQHADSARKFAGLTRVYLALGEVDSAEVTARIHDQTALQTPEEVPLMPYVQLARGRGAEAIALASSSAAAHAARKNLAGAVVGYLQTASLALLANQPRQAEPAARSAYDYALRASDAQSAARALTFVAAAQARLGNDKGSEATFTSLFDKTHRLTEPLTRAAAYEALGDARVRARRWDAGLRAFDSAAAIRARIVEKFDDDFDRVRFTAPFARAFEESLATVARRGDPVLLHRWLQRRKARGQRFDVTTLPQIQSSLRRDEAIIDFLVTPDFVGGMVIAHDTALVFQARASVMELNQHIERIHMPIRPQFGRVDFSRARFDHAAAQQLYKFLLGPVEPIVTGKRRWYISPDDRLHMVPFEALVRQGSGAGAKFVIDSHEVVYVLSSATAGKKTAPDLSRLALVLGEAPGVEKEAKAIQRRVRARVLAGATESAVKHAMQSARIVHFATHAEANLDRPLESHLRLARDRGDDGYFHISEISKTRTRAELVVLTACETVNTRMYGADGAMSIARSFLSAGAGAVLATQWSVGLAAAEFSDHFYAGLRQGKSTAAAAREAKLAMRNNGHANPLIWAPFVVIAGER